MKTRSDSKLAPHEDFIFERLVDGNESYQTVADALHQNFGVQTSASALSQYFAKHSWAWRANRAAQQADCIKDALLHQNFSEAKAKAIAQREFELAASNLSVKDLVALRLSDQREKALELKEGALNQRIREFEEKAAEVRRTFERAKSKGAIDKSTIEEIEQKLAML